MKISYNLARERAFLEFLKHIRRFEHHRAEIPSENAHTTKRDHMALNEHKWPITVILSFKFSCAELVMSVADD